MTTAAARPAWVLMGGGLLAWVSVRTWAGGTPIAPEALAVLGLAGILLCAWAGRGSLLGRGYVSTRIVAALAAGLLGYLVVWPMVLRQDSLPWITRWLAAVFSPLMETAVGPDGELLISTGTGLLSFRPTALLLGLDLWVPWVLWILLWSWMDGRPARAPRLLLCTGLVAFGRVVWNVAVFSDTADVLTRSAPAATVYLHDPWRQLAWLSLVWFLGMPARVRLNTADGRLTAARVTRAQGALAAGFAVAGCMLFVLQARDVWGVTPKAGRVLVDDRLSGRWEPASRRLDNSWFGDMATYSFASAVEWLGYHFATTVNTSRDYTPELLGDYDVLILKTPSLDLSEDEERAILQWVERGGGLFLIGDHTNLFWSSSRLNRLARPAGLEFRFDSVMAAADGSFSYYQPPSLGRHPAVQRLETLEFMTSCSIAVGDAARPMIVVPSQVSQGHDYARSSHFSTVSSDPSLPYGPAVLAATSRLGRGRVAAFGDSTVLSSFALFTWGRERLLLDTVAFLNRAHAAGWAAPAAALLLGLALLGAAYLQLAPSRSRTALAGVFSFALLVAYPGAQILADAWEARHNQPPAPVRPVPRVAILAGDSESIFPPVLGSIEGLDTDWCFDTLLAAIPRSGVMPSLETDLRAAMDAPCLLVLSPKGGLDSQEQEDLGEWVRGGGHLVIAMRDDHAHAAAVQSYLAIASPGSGSAEALHLPGVVPQPWVGSMTRSVLQLGAGAVTLVTGLESWSRGQLGHCFNVPLTEGRQHYAAIASLLAPVAPAHRRTFALLR